MTEEQKSETPKPCDNTPQKQTETPRITNDEKPQVNEVVNKKLAAMSKETKARKKKKLEKPPKDEHTELSVSTMSDNQMFLLLGIIGVIIAGVSLYYQRKTVVKMNKKNERKEETPKVHVPHDVKEDLPEDNALIKW